MPMSINVIDIKNTLHSLDALPIEESVFVLFSEKPDSYLINDYVSLFRIDSESIWPSVGDPNHTQILYSKEKFGTVEYKYNILQDGNNFVLEIDPISPLYTNSRYVLFVEKNLTPEYYELTKSINLSNSSISVGTEKNSNSLVDDSSYSLVITQSSNLSLGNHNIVFDIYQNNILLSSSITLNIKSNNKYYLNTDTFLEFNTNYPFIANERFDIQLNASSRLSTNKIQHIETSIDASIIKTTDDSTRVQYEDILEFYKDNVFIQNQEPSESTKLKVNIKYVKLNKAIITFPVDISSYQISPLSFVCSFSEAFNNYLLGNINAYTEDKKYIVEYSRVSTNSMSILLKYDTDNIVPVNQKYIVVEV